MKAIYLNIKTNLGTETVDEFSRTEGQDPREFNKYVREMQSEYRLSGMNVYKSSRCTNEWKNK